jgi:ABC-type nitrate/sulfonate/bicarbonate transport system permease component
LVQVFLSSLGRMLVGLGLGAGLGIVCGMAAGLNRWVDAAVEPLVELLRPIPVPAIIPPLILMLGVDDQMKLFVVAFSTFFPMFISAAAGVRSVDAVAVDLSRTFQLGRMRTVIKVVFPASLPYVMAGLRTSLALALIVTVVAEMIAGSQGIGFHVMTMQYSIRVADMYAALILLAVVGFLLNAALRFLEDRVLHWFKRGRAD